MRAAAIVVGVFALSLLSCGREVTAPAGGFSAFRRGMFSVDPRFPALANGVSAEAAVAFERVRILLRREDGSIAIDTMVSFPPGAETVTLSLTVPLPANAPTTGVPLAVSMGYINAAGDTVFKGGPFNVNVAPAAPGATAPPPVQVPLQYTGVGSTATAVRITPKTASGLNGDVLSFTAVAVDAAGQTIAGTPIVFATSTPTIISIPNAVRGSATLLGVRGIGTVIAQLLTGQADTSRVTVTLKPSTLALVSGGGQKTGAGLRLDEVVKVKVSAPDGVGVGGVPMTVAVTSGGGTISAQSVTTLSDGTTNVAWTLGPIVGSQSITFTAPGLTGSPLTVNATATALPPSALSVLTPPSSVPINSSLGLVRAMAVDAAGLQSADFDGLVTVALGSNPTGATLSGTKSVRAVSGVAAFPDLTIDKPGSGYTLAFSSGGLSGVTSAPFDIRAGVATRLAFTVQPSAGIAGSALTPAVTVSALDAQGNVAATFGGNVTLTLGGGTSGAVLAGSVSRTAVGGVATFSDLTIDKVGAGYTLSAGSNGLSGATSSAFAVVAGAGARLQLISSNTITQLAGTNVDSVVAAVVDAMGNPVQGRAVGFAVTTGGGSVSSASVTTDALGRAAVRWTLGTVSGTQTLTVSSAGLSGSPMVVTATSTAGTATKIRLIKLPASTWTVGVVSTPITAEVLDAQGNRVSNYATSMTLSIATGPADATLAGTLTATPVAGVATFDGLFLLKTGTYVLQVKSASLPAVMTAEITVKAGAAAAVIADSGTAQSGSVAAPLPVPLVVRVTDSYGNPLAGVSVSWSVTSGGGSLSSSGGVTDANGRARTSLTLGSSAGTCNVRASITSAAGTSTTTISATAVSLQTGTPTKVYLGYENIGITAGVSTPVNIFLDAAPALPVTVDLTTLDSLSKWTTTTVLIPAGSNFAVANLAGRFTGASRAVASAAGLGADTMAVSVYAATVRLLNSYLTLGANGDSIETRVELNAPAPAGGINVSFDLSASGYVHIIPSPGLRSSGGGGGGSLTSANAVTANITNTATVYIKPGETQGYLWVVSESLAGSVTITPVATGYGSQAASATVIARNLSFGGSINLLPGWYSNVYADRRMYAQAPFTITFTSRDSTIVKTPATQTIMANNYSVQVPVTAIATGATYVVASAAGYAPDSLLVRVRKPFIRASSQTLSAHANASTNSIIYLYVYDSLGSSGGTRVTAQSIKVVTTNAAVVSPMDTAVTIPSGSSYVALYYAASSAGSAWLKYSAPGHGSDSTYVTVIGNTQVASWTGTATVGAGQYLSPYLSLAGSSTPRKTATSFTLVSSNPSVAVVDGSVQMQASAYSSENFRLSGLTPGSSTVTWTGDAASQFGSNYQPVTVTTARIWHTNPYYTLTKGGGSQYFTIYTGDSLQYSHYRLTDIDVTVRSTDTLKVKPTSPTVTIYKGGYYNYPYLQPVDTGTAKIILEAPGHRPDTMVVTVSAPTPSTPSDTISRINMSVSSLMLGRRQYTYFYGYRSGNTPATRLSITRKGAATTLSDTAFAMVNGQYYTPNITVNGITNGTDTLIFTAPGHVPDTVVVTVTSPKLSVSVSGENSTLLQNYPYSYLYLYTTDSLGSQHYSMDTVRVNVTSSAPGVARIESTSMAIYPGSYYAYAYMTFPGPGSARFTVADPAGLYGSYTSGPINVVQPRLYFSYSSNGLSLGMRQSTANNETYLYTDYGVLTPTWIKLTRSTSSLVTQPDSLLLNTGYNYVYFRTVAQDTVGGLQVTASAPGFASATASMQVSRPAIRIYSGSMYNGESTRAVDVYSIESGSNYRRATTEDVRVSLATSMSGIATIDSSAVTIAAGTDYNGTAKLRAVGPGQTDVIGTDARSVFQQYLQGRGQMYVYESYMYPQFATYRIGVGQKSTFYTSMNYYTSSPVPFTVKGAGGHSSRTGVFTDSIPAGSYYRYLDFAGLSVGNDTLTITSAGFTQGRVVLEVSPGNYYVSNAPLSLKVGAYTGLYVYIRTPDFSYASSFGTTTLNLSATNGSFIDGANNPVTTATISDGGYYALVYLQAGATPGTATYTISGPNYSTKSFTVQVVP